MKNLYIKCKFKHNMLACCPVVCLKPFAVFPPIINYISSYFLELNKADGLDAFYEDIYYPLFETDQRNVILNLGQHRESILLRCKKALSKSRKAKFINQWNKYNKANIVCNILMHIDDAESAYEQFVIVITLLKQLTETMDVIVVTRMDIPALRIYIDYNQYIDFEEITKYRDVKS